MKLRYLSLLFALSIAFLLISTVGVKAQAISVVDNKGNQICGQVFGSDGDTLTGAIVSCIHLPDSVVIAHSVTDLEGRFTFSENHKSLDSLLLEVSFLGYEKCYKIPVMEEMKIVLIPSSISLDEVVVKSSKSELKQKPGKFLYSPRISEVKGMDSYDLLRFAPLITMENDAISILGKGSSTIYINGRRPIMDNASLMEMLRSTPASQIDKIEIITAPNSSHKASTTGGIVNIIMKKSPNQGLVGSASVSAAYRGERMTPRASLYLGYSNSKFNASANLSFTNAMQLDVTDVSYNYKNTFIETLNTNNHQSRSSLLNGNVSMTYDFTPKSVAGLSFHIGGGSSKSSSAVKSTNIIGGDVDHLSSSSSAVRSPFKRPEVGIVAYYNLKTGSKGSNLDLSASYSCSLNKTFSDMEYSSGMSFSQQTPYSIFQQNSRIESRGYEFRGKYTHFFDENNVLETGYEFNGSRIENGFRRNDKKDGIYVENNLYSNDFLYDEKVNALYISYDRTWSDAFSTTVGVRAENTEIEGSQQTSGETFSRSYWNIFPDLSALLDLADGNHSISLDFSRSIVRPFYNHLNPFKIWTSETTYSMGNIYIKPMIFTDLNLKYVFKNDYIFGISYSYGDDAFSEYTYTGKDNTTVNSLANFGSEQTLSFYLNVHKVLFHGFWRMNVNSSVDYEKIDGTIDGQDAGYDNWAATFGTRNIFRLSARKGITGTISYNYYTPSKSVFKIGKDKHLLNVSVSKQFKFGGILSLDLLNLLNYTPASHYDSDTYSYYNTPRTNNTSVQLRFTMRFGKSQVKGAKDRSSTKHFERFEK